MLNEQVVLSFIGKAANLNTVLGSVEGGLDKIERAIKAVGVAAIAMGTATGAAIGKSAQMAAEFEVGMRNVNSILQESERGYERLSDQILTLATELPKSATDLAQGAYQVASAGFVVAEDTAKVLEAAARASTAGDTDTQTAVTALATVLNAYQLTAADSERVSDALFKTVEAGMVEFDQLAINVGDFIGIAKASGATLEETLGTYAALTIATGQYARSATSLNAVFRSFVNPTEEMDAVLKSLNVSTGQELIQQKGLNGAIRAVTEAVGGQVTAVYDLFQNVEAFNGVQAIMSKTTQESQEFMSQFTDEAKLLGSTSQALSQRQKALNYQLDLIKTSAGAIAIEVGQAFLPALKAAATVVGLLVQAIADLPDWMKQAIGVAATLGATLALAGGAALLFRGKIFLIKMAIGPLRTAISLLIKTQLAQTFASWASSSNLLSGALTSLGGSAAAAAARIGIIVTVAGAAKEILEGGWVRSLFWDQIDTSNAVENLRRFTGETEAVGASADAFGKNFEHLDNVIRRLDWGFLKRNVAGVTFSQAVDDVDALDKALVELSSHNPEEAAAIFQKITDSQKAQGITTAQLRGAFNDYFDAVSAGTAISQENASATAKQEAAAQHYEEVIRKAEEAQQAYNDTIDEAISQAQDFLSLSGVLSGIEEAHRDTWDEATSGMTDAAEAAERLADAQADIEEKQEKINRILYVTGGGPLAGTEAARDLAKLQRELASRQRDLTQEAKSTKEEYKKTPATVGEITKALEEQNRRYQQFNADLTALAGRGVSPEVIAELRGMGQEGADVARAMAKAAPAEFDKMRGVLAEKARLQGREYQEEMNRQQTAAAAIAAAGAQAGVDAILAELDKLAPGMKNKEAAIHAAAAALGVAIHTGLTLPFEDTPGGGDWRTSEQNAARDAAIRAYMGRGRTRDQGGVLPPGTSLIHNNTGRNEYILTPSQMVASGRSGGSSTTHRTEHNYQFGNIYATDMSDIMRRAERARRLKALQGI